MGSEMCIRDRSSIIQLTNRENNDQLQAVHGSIARLSSVKRASVVGPLLSRFDHELVTQEDTGLW